MSIPRLRALREAGTSARHVPIAFVLALAVACGGKERSGIDLGTGPGEFPKVQGYFTRNESVAAVTCEPQAPPTGGDIAMSSYSLSEPIAFTQSGSKVSVVLINYPGDPPDTGTVDMTGKVNLGFKFSIKEQNLRQGRQFYADVTGTFVLNRAADGNTLTGTGTYENVLREGSATAPVFTTCSRTSTVQLTRTGG